MLKILRHETEKIGYRVIEINFDKIRNQKDFFGEESKAEAYRYMASLRRNANRRERNEILRDISGTSAASARRDMGR